MDWSCWRRKNNWKFVAMNWRPYMKQHVMILMSHVRLWLDIMRVNKSQPVPVKLIYLQIWTYFFHYLNTWHFLCKGAHILITSDVFLLFFNLSFFRNWTRRIFASWICDARKFTQYPECKHGSGIETGKGWSTPLTNRKTKLGTRIQWLEQNKGCYHRWSKIEILFAGPPDVLRDLRLKIFGDVGSSSYHFLNYVYHISLSPPRIIFLAGILSVEQTAVEFFII